MFSRREDPYQALFLQRFNAIRTLITTRVTSLGDPNQSHNLSSLAQLLEKLAQELPKFFFVGPNSQELSIFISMYVKYDLIHIDAQQKNTLIQMTGIGATKLEEEAENPDIDLTIKSINNFYIQASRILNTQDIRPPHALILFKSKLYHYNNTIIPPLLTEKVFATLQPNEKEPYTKLKHKLANATPYHLHSANQEDRTNMASLLGIRTDDQLQRLNLQLVERLLESLESLIAKHKKTWHDSRIRSISNGVQAAACTVILACFLYPFVTLFIIELCLLSGGLMLAGGLGFAVYAYHQEQFYTTLVKVFSEIPSVATYPGAPPNTVVTSSLNNFFKKHKTELDSAFTEANHTRAGLTF